jgi:hypothetical protein
MLLLVGGVPVNRETCLDAAAGETLRLTSDKRQHLKNPKLFQSPAATTASF